MRLAATSASVEITAACVLGSRGHPGHGPVAPDLRAQAGAQVGVRGQHLEYTFSDPKNITIFATSKHPKEAWQFIKWYINRENDAAFLKETWEFPFRKELIENPQRFSPQPSASEAAPTRSG
jgi:Bacterial extracellular solute-binding protein